MSNTIEEGVGLPPSLAVTPNIAWEHQIVDQLIAERDYWLAQVASAPGPASAGAAAGFAQACTSWINHRATQPKANPAGGDRG